MLKTTTTMMNVHIFVSLVRTTRGTTAAATASAGELHRSKASSSITLKMGIEARLKEEIPEVEKVVAL